jgi:hypothetical protein
MTRPQPDLDRLAELDADVAAGLPVDPAAVPADADSRSVLDALAATRAELGSLPPVPLPAEVTDRWRAALAAARAAEPGPPDRPVDEPAEGPGRPSEPGPNRGRAGGDRAGQDRQMGASPATYGRERTEPASTGRPPARPERRRRRARPAVAAGLTLAVLLVVAGLLQPGEAQPRITAAQLGGVATAAVGTHDAGELADPVRRAACLNAVAPPGLRPDAPLVGGRGVVLEGRRGVLLVLSTGKLGSFRVVVVDPACTELLADTLIGR